MYYWKIWRETRVRFFALLILGACLGVLAVWSQVPFTVAVVAKIAWEPGQKLPPVAATAAWNSGITVLMITGGFVLFFLGAIVASSGLGEEMERGTAPFLLTRPRSRGYFVWSFWLVAAVELLFFTAVVLLAGYATLFYMIRRAGPWSFLLLGPILMITGLLAVGFANLLTTGCRRSNNGFAGTLAFTGTYLAAIPLLRYFHVINLPSPLKIYSLDWNAALAGAMLGWLATAVAFIALSHLIVTRMEV